MIFVLFSGLGTDVDADDPIEFLAGDFRQSLKLWSVGDVFLLDESYECFDPNELGFVNSHNNECDYYIVDQPDDVNIMKVARTETLRSHSPQLSKSYNHLWIFLMNNLIGDFLRL